MLWSLCTLHKLPLQNIFNFSDAGNDFVWHNDVPDDIPAHGILSHVLIPPDVRITLLSRPNFRFVHRSQHGHKGNHPSFLQTTVKFTAIFFHRTEWYSAHSAYCPSWYSPGSSSSCMTSTPTSGGCSTSPTSSTHSRDLCWPYLATTEPRSLAMQTFASTCIRSISWSKWTWIRRVTATAWSSWWGYCSSWGCWPSFRCVSRLRGEGDSKDEQFVVQMLFIETDHFLYYHVRYKYGAHLQEQINATDIVLYQVQTKALYFILETICFRANSENSSSHHKNVFMTHNIILEE